jgi:acyl-[acyl-carrier-protein] desaturase
MNPRRAEVVSDMEPVLDSLLESVRSVEASWQPSELLPSVAEPSWREEIAGLRDEARVLSDDVLVVLVGNVVTEEALPSYQTALNRFDGMTDASGVEGHAWARWSRYWTAEEKRHGDVTRGYLYLCGRVNLRAVEDTIQHLLRNGFDTRADGDPYRGLAYAAFQEHATKTCWNQLGRLVGTAGAPRLHRICGLIAADEARHERIYVALLREVLARDPAGALDALVGTLGPGVVMPARTMTDGRDGDLFTRFAEVGQRLGVYTLDDYAENLSQLVDAMGLRGLAGLAGEAERHRDLLCELPSRIAGSGGRRSRRGTSRPFRWLEAAPANPL